MRVRCWRWCWLMLSCTSVLRTVTYLLLSLRQVPRGTQPPPERHKPSIKNSSKQYLTTQPSLSLSPYLRYIQVPYHTSPLASPSFLKILQTKIPPSFLPSFVWCSLFSSNSSASSIIIYISSLPYIHQPRFPTVRRTSTSLPGRQSLFSSCLLSLQFKFFTLPQPIYSFHQRFLSDSNPSNFLSTES